MTAYIVMGIIVVWAGAWVPFVRYLERKERDQPKRKAEAP